MWLIYLIGIAVAVAAARLLRLTVFRGETTPFVMELPPYRMPTPKSILLHLWQRGCLFLRKAGTVILGISIVLWAMAHYPRPNPAELTGLNAEQARQTALESSAIGRAGRLLEPVIRPLGFDWKIGTALIGAIAAKEVFVSQLSIIYATNSGSGAEELRRKLRADYSPLAAFCIMLFCLLSAPCVSTVAMTRQETNSWKWAAFQAVGLTGLAYALTFLVYQGGRLFA
jgi:ferrous iron transport protein B